MTPLEAIDKVLNTLCASGYPSDTQEACEVLHSFVQDNITYLEEREYERDEDNEFNLKGIGNAV